MNNKLHLFSTARDFFNAMHVIVSIDYPIMPINIGPFANQCSQRGKAAHCARRQNVATMRKAAHRTHTLYISCSPQQIFLN